MKGTHDGRTELSSGRFDPDGRTSRDCANSAWRAYLSAATPEAFERWFRQAEECRARQDEEWAKRQAAARNESVDGLHPRNAR